jgi:tetratricopeptide (TPR) repeat protein
LPRASIRASAAGLTDSVAQETRLTRYERATIIDAQARQIAATVLRLQGRPDERLGELSAARAAVVAVKEGRVLSTARLEAQIVSEMALAHEAAGRFGEADSLLHEALALIELRYPESASVNAAKARLAAYFARRGRRDESLALYREVVGDVTKDRGALVGLENQVRPYFAMLIEDLPRQPTAVSDLFMAAQLIERPGAAADAGAAVAPALGRDRRGGRAVPPGQRGRLASSPGSTCRSRKRTSPRAGLRRRCCPSSRSAARGSGRCSSSCTTR